MEQGNFVMVEVYQNIDQGHCEILCSILFVIFLELLKILFPLLKRYVKIINVDSFINLNLSIFYFIKV